MINIDEWVKRIIGADWSYNMSDDYSVYERGRIKIEKMIQDAKKELWSTEDLSNLNSKIKNRLMELYDGKCSEASMNFYIGRVNWLSQFAKNGDENE